MPECSVVDCERDGRHWWMFHFLDDYTPVTLYCDAHSQQRGELSEVSEYLGGVDGVDPEDYAGHLSAESRERIETSERDYAAGRASPLGGTSEGGNDG